MDFFPRDKEKLFVSEARGELDIGEWKMENVGDVE